jgi:hypothetical protein
MLFLDKSEEASDKEKVEQLRLAEQERELHHSRAVTEEQAKRLRAQEKAAKKNKQIIGLVAGGLLVTTALSLYALGQRNEANKQQLIAIEERDKAIEAAKEATEQEALAKIELKNKGSVTKALILQTNSNKILNIYQNYGEKLQATLWQLVSDNKLAEYDIPSSQSISNRLDKPTLILKLNEDGHQTSPTILEPGQSTLINGFVNQVWIAREAGDGRVLEVGIMTTESSTAVFENQ